jgi:proprotein convertase subtilisin/kexin type 5
VHPDAFSEEAQHTRRNLQINAYQPIRITTDFSRLQSLPTSVQDVLQKQVEIAAEFFADILQVPVQPSPGNNTLPPDNFNCGSEIAYSGDDILYGFADSDLHLFISTINDPNSNLLAYASACTLNSLYRPNTGKVIFNLYYLDPNVTEIDKFNDLLKVTMHELTHVLGFSASLYQYYLNPANGSLPYLDQVSTIFSNSTPPLLKTPLVTELARQYYNCPSIQGMRLEDEGSSASLGSHWERVVLQNEYMTASSVGWSAAVSNFTLSLLQDSGWYQVNFNHRDEVYWGRAKGCDFFDFACNASSSYTFNEFSLLGNNSCDFNSFGKGYLNW